MGNKKAEVVLKPLSTVFSGDGGGTITICHRRFPLRDSARALQLELLPCEGFLRHGTPRGGGVFPVGDHDR